MGEESKDRNYAIEFYRFLFACIVYILHVRGNGNFNGPNGQFNGGYLAVEFFFILSGFLMAGQLKRATKLLENGTSPEIISSKYFSYKYKKLMPQYWLSIVVLILVDNIVFDNFSIKSAILKGIPEILAIQLFWRPNGINGQLWFVSALIWASYFVFYLLLKHRDFALHIFFPVFILVSFGFIYKNVGYLDLVDNSKFYLAPFVRAFSEISFGCILYDLYIQIKSYSFNFAFMSGIELCLISIILIVMWRTRRDYKDFIMVFVLGGHILITMLCKGILSRILNHKIFGYLGSISYSMYVNQLIIQRITKHYYSIYPFWIVTVCGIFATLIYSLIVNRLFTYFIKKHFQKNTAL